VHSHVVASVLPWAVLWAAQSIISNSHLLPDRIHIDIYLNSVGFSVISLSSLMAFDPYVCDPIVLCDSLFAIAFIAAKTSYSATVGEMNLPSLWSWYICTAALLSEKISTCILLFW